MSGKQSEEFVPEEHVRSAEEEYAELEEARRSLRNVYHKLAYSFVVSITQMFSIGGLGIAAFSARDVAASMHATNPSEMVWYMAAYALTGGVFVLVAGAVGDVVGHKYALVFGWLWTALWSLLSGFATNSIYFDVMRGLAGIGNAAVTPCAVALLARAFPAGSPWKNLSFALFGFFAPSGFVMGGAVAAGMTHSVNWRWAYYLWAILSLVFGILSFLVIPHSLGKSVPGATMRTFDYLGSFLGIGGLLLFAFAWIQAGILGWEVTYTYVLLIIGVVLTIAFAFWETRAKQPVHPPSMWKRRGFTPVAAAMCFGWMSFGVFLYFAPEFLMTFRNLSPRHAVAETSPVVVTGAIGTLFVALVVDRISVKIIFMISAFGFLFGNLMFSVTPERQTYWAMAFPGMALVALGPDLSFTSASIVITNTVLPDEQGAAGSFINTLVLYGSGLGMGFAGVVQRYVMRQTGDALLASRSALWFGLGLSAMAMLVVILFVHDPRFEKNEDAASEA
ncbi:hypothetical protein MSPP1_003115 [Malassezia sp. CBS 17886]|nr:hypothetical protein MSPP1_003115 [Malassezia sp. CBS 17886]